MVVCSFSWANDKRLPNSTYFSSPPQLCQILCLKNYYYEKSEEEAEYLRPVRDGLIGTWSIRISNASGSDIASEPTTFGSEPIRLGLLSSLLPRALGEEGMLSSSSSPPVSCCKATFLLCSFY